MCASFGSNNPHTKPFPFWEWLIAEIKRDCPEAIFLAEAFTRPKVTYRLAKLGFTQSYNYFPWRNTKWELTQYFTELTRTEAREFFGPNLWPNTPDILAEYLQFGGRPAFMARLILAATLGPSYGIYGPAYELCESRPLAPGREEYLDSEKYEIRTWDIDRPDSLRDLIARSQPDPARQPGFSGQPQLALPRSRTTSRSLPIPRATPTGRTKCWWWSISTRTTNSPVLSRCHWKSWALTLANRIRRTIS